MASDRIRAAADEIAAHQRSLTPDERAAEDREFEQEKAAMLAAAAKFDPDNPFPALTKGAHRMIDFQMVWVTDRKGNPVWINVRQICAVTAGDNANAVIYMPGHGPLQCVESVDEVLQLIVNAINGDIDEEPADEQ